MTDLANDAWIGDAVLTLHARLKILRDDGRLDGGKCIRLTSNKFLSAIGEPTRVEAQIGRVFETSGLAAAFAWIDQHLLPIFERQEENRLRKDQSVRRDQRMSRASTTNRRGAEPT